MQLYVQPRVVKPTKYILDRIPESDPEETDECMQIAAYPFVSDRNAARLDHNPMSPVPREPADTIVERTGKKLRAVIFDSGSPSSDAHFISLRRISLNHRRNNKDMQRCCH